MSRRAKISMVIRGMIVGGLGTLALLSFGIQAPRPDLSRLDDPNLIVIEADFSKVEEVKPVRMSDGATVPIEVQFQ